MEKHKLEDFINAAKDETSAVVVSSFLPEVVKDVGSYVVSESVGILISEIVGALFPVANNIRISYKQNRMERNIVKAFERIQEKQDELTTQLENMQKDYYEFQRQVTEVFLDNIIDEPQDSLVEYNVNGYINILKSAPPSLDMAIMFFKTLSQLNDLDVRILKVYDDSWSKDEDAENIWDICEELELNGYEIEFVKEKLERFGLLHGRNEEIADKNMEEIVNYLQALERESKKRQPKTVKIPKLKKRARTESYKITSLGRRYIEMITG